MTATMYFSGPDPEGAWYYCTPCAMIFKEGFTRTEEGQAFLKDAAVAENGQERHADVDVAVNRAPRPQRAVAVASCTIQGPWGPNPVPVCWSHMVGLELRPGGAVAPATMLPPGLNGGQIPRIGRG